MVAEKQDGKLTKRVNPVIKRTYKDELTLIEGYITFLLALSGVKLPQPSVTVLSYAVKYKKLSIDIKRLIAERTKSDVQVVSNNITKLRKMKLLEGQLPNKKLIPPSIPTTVILNLNIEENKNEEGK